MRPFTRFPLTSFFALAYAWTWCCWWTAAAVSNSYISFPVSVEHLATLGQFGPFVAALCVTIAVEGRAGLVGFWKRLTRWRVGPAWVVVSLLLFPAIMLVAIYWHAASSGTLATLRFRDTWSTLPAHFVYTLFLCGPLGEEPGWRGFALPRLQASHGPVMASIWLGLLWAGWHLPLWWMNSTMSPYLLYVVSVVLGTFLFTWLFNHTQGSAFYSLVFHASLNTAGVRLPDVAAHAEWVVCLSVVVLLILLCDRRFWLAGRGHSSSGITIQRMM